VVFWQTLVAFLAILILNSLDLVLHGDPRTNKLSVLNHSKASPRLWIFSVITQLRSYQHSKV